VLVPVADVTRTCLAAAVYVGIVVITRALPDDLWAAFASRAR
jgi:hypothetical protein